ncbi:MAG: hypothetical protein ACW99U_17140 [Candidatus Thorarchaeota archaeon]
MSYTEDFKAAEKAKTAVDVTPTWFAFEAKGQFVLGKLMGTSEVDSSLGSGTYLQYLMDTDDGLIKFSLGAATDKELHTVLHTGSVYKIMFMGKQKIKGGRSVNQFKVLALEAPEETAALGVTDDDVPF